MHQLTRDVVKTRAGLVRGAWRSSGSMAFLGIPFAQPAVGDLRFMAPVPAEPWEGERDATRYGATPARRPVNDDPWIPEPCYAGDAALVLNVFTPAACNTKSRLPVLVWIHGGSYEGGSPSSPWYDGMAFNERSVVTVSISYRVGFDGFGHVEGSDAPLNRGFLDQVMALEWVRDNIEQFGGDPKNVTIAGQSAGGGSVLCHLASPRSEGLFSGAIAQSPVVADRPLGRARDTAARLAKRLGIEPTLDAWRSVSEDQILDASVELAEPIRFAPDPVAFARDGLEVASLPSDQWARHMAFGPVFDPQDAFLPESVMAATSRGAGFDVPLLIGCTRHEYTSLTDPMRSVWNAQSDARSVFTSVGFPRLGTWAMMREFSELGEDTTRLLGQLLTAALFHFPVVHIVRARQAARVASTCDIETGLTIPAKKAGTWVYEFAWQKPSTGLADHCADVPFVFNCLRDDDVERIFGTATPPRGLATAIQNDWVRFIRSGDPSFPAWREGERGRIYGAEGQYSVKSARPFKVELNMMRLMRER